MVSSGDPAVTGENATRAVNGEQRLAGDIPSGGRVRHLPNADSGAGDGRTILVFKRGCKSVEIPQQPHPLLLLHPPLPFLRV